MAQAEQGQETFRWNEAKNTWENVSNYAQGLPRPNKETVSAALTVLACRLGQIIIIGANVKPYSRLVSDLLTKVFDVSIWGGFNVGLGFILLAGIQSAELRPMLLHRPNPEKLKRVENIAALMFMLDEGLAVYNWPPLKVSLARFFAVTNFGDIHWVNCMMIAAIVFGVVYLQSLITKVSRDI